MFRPGLGLEKLQCRDQRVVKEGREQGAHEETSESTGMSVDHAHSARRLTGAQKSPESGE